MADGLTQLCLLCESLEMLAALLIYVCSGWLAALINSVNFLVTLGRLVVLVNCELEVVAGLEKLISCRKLVTLLIDTSKKDRDWCWLLISLETCWPSLIDCFGRLWALINRQIKRVASLD